MDHRDMATLAPLAPEAFTSVRDHVHKALRMAILSGRYAAEEMLNERHLAEQLGVSTTPVKEALRRLETEGLVLTRPRRGVVSLFSKAWAEEMIMARVALESTISKMAALRITPGGAEELRAVAREMIAATEADDADRLIALNEKFHDCIHRISQCRYLGALIDRQQIYDDSFRRVIHSDPSERSRALNEHRAIADAIADGKPDAAEASMRTHVERSGEKYLAIAFP